MSENKHSHVRNQSEKFLNPPPSTTLVDIGLNLANHAFKSDWQEVIARAEAAGVEKFVLTGTSLSITATSLELATALGEGKARFTAGVHPHHSSELAGNATALGDLRGLALHPLCAAVGETGLDYARDLAPRDVQKSAFEAQIALACDIGKPLFIHEREAAEDLLRTLDKFRHHLPRCVVHCFTGTAAQAEAYLERGFYLGVTGGIGQSKRNAALLEAIKRIPANRLMLETDAPYLTPPGYRPPVRGRNEPAAMAEIARLVAEARGESVAAVRAAAHAATSEFFGF